MEVTIYFVSGHLCRFVVDEFRGSKKNSAIDFLAQVRGPLGCDCGPEWMFGEELHYRGGDVADLHDLSLRGNFVRVGSIASWRAQRMSAVV